MLDVDDDDQVDKIDSADVSVDVEEVSAAEGDDGIGELNGTSMIT